MEQKNIRNKGFTLIELSIVVVIIGLIVAGVVAGQSLVRQAKLRGVVADINKYTAAYNTFMLQYNGRPGDLANANDYWPGCGTGHTAAQCNGDGNKQINSANSTTDDESLRYWQHLANAGLISGTFTGVASSTGGFHAYHQTGINTPENSLGGCLHSHYRVPLGALAVGNAFKIGREESSNAACHSPIVTPVEAFAIETKLGDDDGGARSGRFWVGVASCYSGNAYNLSYTGLCLITYVYDKF